MSDIKNFVTWIKNPFSFIVLILLIGLSVLVYKTTISEQFKPNEISYSESLYFQPEDLKSLIQITRQSSVTIYCGESAGSGWFIDLEDSSSDETDDKYPYEIVTNFHVVDQCDFEQPIYFTSSNFSGEFVSYLFNYDSENDLALLMTDVEFPALTPAAQSPEIGHWVMAVGSPGGAFNLDGSVTTGRVTNLDGHIIATDAAINFGNSGGPLINSNGEVLGTNSWREDASTIDNIAYAQGVPALCLAILNCSSDSSLNW